MNLSQLGYFRVLALYEHYTRAAQKLSISQPSLTHSIKALEQELGVSLFDRQGRQVKLNRYGKLYLEYVERALDNLEKGREKLNIMVDPNKGTIKFGYLSSISASLVPTLIRHFQAQTDNSQISFEFTEGATALIQERLQLGQLDIAIAANIDAPNITSIPLYDEQLFVVVPYGHALESAKSLTMEDLVDYKLITYKSSSGIRAVIDGYFEERGLQPDIIYEFTGEQTICGFVQAGLGMAIVPDVKGIENFNIVKIPFENPLIARSIYVNYSSSGYLSPPVKKLIDYILGDFKAYL